MLLEVVGEERVEVQPRVATVDAMVAVGVNLRAELYAGLYECLAILRRVAEVDVVVRHAVNQQQVAVELVDAVHGR